MSTTFGYLIAVASGILMLLFGFRVGERSGRYPELGTISPFMRNVAKVVGLFNLLFGLTNLLLNAR